MANPNPTPRNWNEDVWSDKEIAYLKKNYPKKDNESIAAHLGRSIRSIRSQAARLRLKKATRYWDKPDEDYVLDSWPVMSAEEIGAKLGKTKWAVINKYRELKGLRKK